MGTNIPDHRHYLGIWKQGYSHECSPVDLGLQEKCNPKFSTGLLCITGSSDQKHLCCVQISLEIVGRISVHQWPQAVIQDVSTLPSLRKKGVREKAVCHRRLYSFPKILDDFTKWFKADVKHRMEFCGTPWVKAHSWNVSAPFSGTYPLGRARASIEL